MIYQSYEMTMIPPCCSLCSFPVYEKEAFCSRNMHINLNYDMLMDTRNEYCPLRSGSVMDWIDVRDRLPDFTGPVLVTVIDRKFNSDPAPEVKAATYKTKYKQFFRVTGNVIAWMPYPETYRR